MARFFSLPTSRMKETREEKALEGSGSITRDVETIVTQTETAPTTISAPATTLPRRKQNKLHKPRPFSMSVPFKKKSGSTSSSSSLSSEQNSISVTMPFFNSSSSSDSISSLATPPKDHTESKPRLRTISLRSLRPRSSHRGHSHSASESAVLPSAQSTKGISSSSSGSVSSASTSPSVSPMKKVTGRVKESIRRLGGSLHLVHVTSKSRPVDHDHSDPHPSPPPAPSPTLASTASRKSTTSQDSSGAKVHFNVNQHEAEDNPAQGLEAETLDDAEPESRPQPELKVESSSTNSSGDSDGPLSVQAPDSLTIVSTVLSPVAEMPSPVTPSAPVPSTIDAVVGDEQPKDVLSPSEPALNTSVYVETEVPDPFLLDEEGDAISDEEKGERTQAEDTLVTLPTAPLEPPAAQEIALGASTATSTTGNATSPVISEASLPSPLNVNKDVPPPPAEEVLSGAEQEEEVPDLFLPRLVVPTMLLPIPNTDPLTTLLTKYIYPPEKRPVRDVSGDWKRTDMHTLVMTNSWRALARMARDRIVASNPGDVENILGLWSLRLASLARLRLSNQTAAECTNLFAVLNTIEPTEHRVYVFENILPFELEVMYARVKYWSGDHMSYLDALNALLKKCKRKAREAFVMGKDESEAQEIKDMWKERGARISLIIASQLVEMKDFTLAAKLLEPLCTKPASTTGETGPITNPHLRSAIARIYIQAGNVQLAAHHFSLVAQDPSADESLKKLNEAILGVAEGDWDKTVDLLKGLIEEDEGNFVAVNNLSVALLSQGKLKEAIEVLENALKLSPSTVVVAEPFLFNLSTLYELRSAAGLERKKDLLIEVAKWSGDGLRTNCLKMPTN